MRLDSGGAVPALYDWCEQAGIAYTIGLITNPPAGPPWPRRWLAEAQRAAGRDGAEKVRLLGEAPYQAESWAHPRRVVIKAEALPKGPNTRFVVTTRPDPPEALYDWYVERGEPENWIKDLKSGLLRRPPERPPLLGQPVPPAAACRGLLAPCLPVPSPFPVPIACLPACRPPCLPAQLPSYPPTRRPLIPALCPSPRPNPTQTVPFATPISPLPARSVARPSGPHPSIAGSRCARRSEGRSNAPRVPPMRSQGDGADRRPVPGRLEAGGTHRGA